MLILDIETFADESPLSKFHIERKLGRYKDPRKIEEYQAKYESELALSPLTGRIVAVVAIKFDEVFGEYDVKDVFKKVIIPTDEEEKKLLAELKDFVKDEEYFVSYNGKTFDFPFIMIRGAKYGIDIKLPVEMYRTEKHFDLFNNFFKQGTLAEWAYFFGVIKEMPTDTGADIASMVINGEYDKVLYKCFNDVIITQGVYARIQNLI